MKAAQVKKALRKKSKKLKISTRYIGSGSTLVNLACTGKTSGAYPLGTFVLFVGDSDTGKTWLALTAFAEATLRACFKEHRFIFDNAENGAMMDMERFFGKELASRLEPPATDKSGNPVFSKTGEDFYYHLDDAFQQGQPFIYVLDSENALDSDADEVKFQEDKQASREGKEKKGTYGTGKASLHSRNLRRVVGQLHKTNSVLIMISQTRDNIGFGFDPKTRSGGRALKFYSHIEMWASKMKTLKKRVRKKERQIGVLTKVEVKRTRVTGKKRTVTVPIYNTYGVDDVGSCIDYLVEEGHWKNVKGNIKAVEFDYEGERDGLIRHIEECEMEKDLRSLVGEVWNEIENASTIGRKPRYG